MPRHNWLPIALLSLIAGALLCAVWMQQRQRGMSERFMSPSELDAWFDEVGESVNDFREVPRDHLLLVAASLQHVHGDGCSNEHECWRRFIVYYGLDFPAERDLFLTKLKKYRPDLDTQVPQTSPLPRPRRQ